MKSIHLTSGEIALVDDADFALVEGYSWNLHSRGYATAYAGGGRKNQKYVLMHKLIAGTKEIDHKNGNKLDNRRENLRTCSRAQNNANKPKQGGSSTSSFKGVRFHKQNQKWTAQIGVEGGSRYLGSFSLEEEAAKAYDTAAIELFGAFAKVNFP